MYKDLLKELESDLEISSTRKGIDEIRVKYLGK